MFLSVCASEVKCESIFVLVLYPPWSYLRQHVTIIYAEQKQMLLLHQCDIIVLSRNILLFFVSTKNEKGNFSKVTFLWVHFLFAFLFSFIQKKYRKNRKIPRSSSEVRPFNKVSFSPPFCFYLYSSQLPSFCFFHPHRSLLVRASNNSCCNCPPIFVPRMNKVVSCAVLIGGCSATAAR